MRTSIIKFNSLHSYKSRFGSQFKVTCGSLGYRSTRNPYWRTLCLSSIGWQYEHWFSLQLLMTFLSVFRKRTSHCLIILFTKSFYLASVGEIVSTCIKCVIVWNVPGIQKSKTSLATSGRVRSEVKSQVVKESGASERLVGVLASADAVALWTSTLLNSCSLNEFCKTLSTNHFLWLPLLAQIFIWEMEETDSVKNGSSCIL